MQFKEEPAKQEPANEKKQHLYRFDARAVLHPLSVFANWDLQDKKCVKCLLLLLNQNRSRN